ncbi:peroxiredoxin [Streptomyces sp. NPDC015131]|uniref:peroxiredoxin n=1 Tax=Streptomyces sp. NPDC015131 TaxID=3364941 RepID=UPI0036F7CD54
MAIEASEASATTAPATAGAEAPVRAGATAPVRVGARAPEFTLKDNHGRTVSLADFRGEKNVVLLFYPFAFTGVCTGELCALRDELPTFVNDDTQLLAVSNDSIHTLRVFAEQEGLEYPLLSDFWPHGEVSRAYGVFAEDKGCAVRGTFIIDKEGVVRWTVVNGLADARDPKEYAAALDTL